MLVKISKPNLSEYRRKLSNRLSFAQRAAKKALRKMAPPSSKRTVHLRHDTYMICCPARSGSTMLVHLLRSHPQVLSHGEVMGHEVTGLMGPLGRMVRQDSALHRHLQDIRRDRPAFFLYNYILDSRGHKAVGFKLKYDELANPAYRDVLECVLQDGDLKIVFLDRENLFERYVSHHFAGVTGVTLVHGGAKAPKVEPVRLDWRDMERNFQEQLARRDRFRKLFRSHRSIETTYEKLTINAPVEMAKVYKFLGVDEHHPATPTKKILSSDLRSLISNYDEVIAHFARSRFATFFQRA